MNKLLIILVLCLCSINCNAQYTIVLKESIPRSKDTFKFGTTETPLKVDNKGIIMNGKPVLPVMGEIHYARVPERDWRREIAKMKAGGISIISTYIFWNHHETSEGVWDWSGNKNLRAFAEACKALEVPLVLRLGPFCHGEVYQGGVPDWIVQKSIEEGFKTRSMAPQWIEATRKLYNQIAQQVKGLYLKDGGPIIGVQLENECRGPWNYYKALKEMALEAGFDVPFFTRTGWPQLSGKEEFGEILPLYGDYADGFWDRTLDDMPGEYSRAFVFKQSQVSATIATETFSKEEMEAANGSNPNEGKREKLSSYPYLTCELGGGMHTSYHRRINISGEEMMPLAICKVGSGSNLPGYYMYHGGTNPSNPHHTMGELQNSPVTNYNDVPYMTYDFQCPLGEMGQMNEKSFHKGRILHELLQTWGEQLSGWDVIFPSESKLRWSVRTDGEKGFIFVNNYERMKELEEIKDVEFVLTTTKGKEVRFPKINVKNGVSFMLPFNLEIPQTKVDYHKGTLTKSKSTINYATAQPFIISGSTIGFVAIDGIEPIVCLNGTEYKLTLNKRKKVGDISLVAFSYDKAKLQYRIGDEILQLDKKCSVMFEDGGEIFAERWKTKKKIRFSVAKETEGLREVKMGSQKVAEMPVESDFSKAEVYVMNEKDLKVNKNYENMFLKISYKGDVARVYADGKLVQDNFWNGKPMYVRLSDIKGKKVEVKILPLGKEYPIYLQKEQKEILNNAEGDWLLNIDSIELIERVTI